MGKTPKKAAPGGDERNLYVRRLKATTTSSSKGCDTSQAAKQRESDNSNRVKPIGVQKRLPVPVAKVFKSKLRSPSRTNYRQALKNPTRFQPPTCRDEKKLAQTTVVKSQDNEEITTMHAESEDTAAVQLKVSITKKDAKETSEKNGPGHVDEEGTPATKNENPSFTSHSSSNGKEIVELTEIKDTTPRNESPKETCIDLAIEKSTSVELSMIKLDNGMEILETIESTDVKEVTELESFESDDNSLKLMDEPEVTKSTEQKCVTSHEFVVNGRKEEIIAATTEITRNDKLTLSTENGSSDIVESTTSETSDSGNATQSDKESIVGDQAKEIVNDPSFVSYDSSIMLKDVQIKLNDCLKENTKLYELSTDGEENCVTADEQAKRLDMSFGKTLRNITGRGTINRLRYVTVRENRFSPNSSLFVNTSSASLDLDDPACSKLSRYPTDISDSIICNGSPAVRKRKIGDNARSSSKKLKTDTSSGLLNTSLEMLKGIRRPVEVSTPNPKGYKFQTDRMSYKGFGDEKLTIDSEVEPKKWCIVM